MKCADAGKCIALDVEGDLPEARVAALRNHLAACAPCEQFAQEMRESQEVLKSLRHETPPESLLSGARQAALEELRTQPRDGGWGWAAQPRLRWVYATGGLAVVAWATMGWMTLQKSEAPRSAAAGAASTRNQESVAKVVAIPEPVSGIHARDESTTSTSDSTESAAAVRSEEQTVARQTVGNRDRDLIARVPGFSSGEGTAPFDAPPKPESTERVAPRVEIVSSGFSKNSPDLDSGTTVLKIASKDPNVLLYWVMDGQGGS
jgi:hypothetical protein